ncbi:MAG TPA: glycosyltransferase family A protein [Verrucomicrobiales bacterium]|nr:glycosyltransferase family A protein [Verrucomicrobiales bacterium]
MPEPPRVSVIMRSRNSERWIEAALGGLFGQSFRDIEVLVVDSGSRDATLEIASRFPCRIIGIPAESYFPGRVLNRAIPETAGEVLVFQNSDCIPAHENVLAALLEAFWAAEAEAAFGRQTPRADAWPWVRRDYARAYPATGPAPGWLPLSLAFAAMRRSSWRERPFYETAWGSEDIEWGTWARKTGRKVVYVPAAAVEHSHNYTLRQLYGRRFIEGEADAFIHGGRNRWRDLSGRWVRAIARDVMDGCREGEWKDLVGTPVRRWIYHWAYHRGHRHGERRISRQDGDGGLGQRVVLERQE